MTPRLLHLSFVVLAAVLAAACGSGGDGPQATYAEAPCPSPNVAGIPALELGPQFECGFLTVPENRAQPHGKTVRIAVARARASSAQPRRAPVLYLAGGPGGTGLATAVLRVQDGWNADRDVIFIDQRGTLHADPLLACPEIDAFVAEAMQRVASDPATLARGEAATRACRDRLARQGHDLAAFDTAQNAADIADLRVALGIDEWHVYGVSYGSDLALQLLRDHPAGIRSLVLDSVVPPDVNLVAGFWPNAALGYRALFDGCAAEPACHAAYPNLESAFNVLVHQLDAVPRRVTVTDPATNQPIDVMIDGYTLANLVVIASLVPGSIADVPALVHNLAFGDGSAAALALLGNRPPPGLTGYGLTYGVFCREQVAFTDAAHVKTAAVAALPGFPDRVVSLVPQSPNLLRECAAWNVGRAADAAKAPARSTVPVLLLAGSFDAITPPAWADHAARTLDAARVITFPGAGHDVMIWSPACALAVMRSFLEHPDAVDESCVRTLHNPPFRVAASALALEPSR